MGKRDGEEGYNQALHRIFELYWREELREAREAVEREGEKPVPHMDKRLRRRNQWMCIKGSRVYQSLGRACAVLIIATGLVFAVNKEARAWFATFVKEVYVEYVNFFSLPHVNEEDIEPVPYELGYVPEGYTLWNEEFYSDDYSGYVGYMKGENLLWLDYRLNREGAYVNADSTDMVWRETFLSDGTLAQYGESIPPAEELRYLIWEKDGYLYELIGTVSEGELRKMAEGVRPAE
ncbi:MAG: DUF4367 domain-containing protein [Roseburia sp.]|nr:DUF4367 domain-containing protein [Roseburia sp.]